MPLTVLAFVLSIFSSPLTANLETVSGVSVAMADTITVTPGNYRIYKSNGTPATFADIAAALKKTDVVFVGEQHDDPVSHHIEKLVLEAMFETYGEATALSMEMFARDVQYIVDEYLAGLITESHFQSSSSPWSNYETDYKPLVEFAKSNGMAVIAANAPRRYANRVTREGRPALMQLSDQALTFVAPQPYGAASERYTAQWNKVMAEAMGSMKSDEPAEEEIETEMEKEMGEEAHDMENMTEEHAKMHAEHMAAKARGEEHAVGAEHEMNHAGEKKEGMEHKEGMKHEAPAAPAKPAMPAAPASSSQHGNDTMLDAQTLWDATMAWSIAEHLTRRPGSKVVHMVGGFHSETGTGTPEHLVQYRPGTRFMVITMKTVDDINVFDTDEHTGMGDFVILGDASLPRTYASRTR